MPPPPTFSGALGPKKKSELQQIATALAISDAGTKEELTARLKFHLDSNQTTLEDNPTFAGLFVARRKRTGSVQPQLPPPPSSRFAPDSDAKLASRSRRITALEPVRESTPIVDLRNVSTYLKQPIQTPDRSPKRVDVVTPSSLPPLPPSPTLSVVRHTSLPLPLPQPSHEERILQNFVAFRTFLSNSRNIWSITALLELVYIISVVVPWKHYTNAALPSLTVTYPPLETFTTSPFWIVILHWAIPTLFVPAVFGNLISFNPAPHSTSQIAPFDPLTGSIIRLASHVAYPYASLEESGTLQGLDVLGFRWRVLNAAVGLAFAYAEQISGAPELFAQSFLRKPLVDDLPLQLSSLQRELTTEDTLLEVE